MKKVIYTDLIDKIIEFLIEYIIMLFPLWLLVSVLIGFIYKHGL